MCCAGGGISIAIGKHSTEAWRMGKIRNSSWKEHKRLYFLRVGGCLSFLLPAASVAQLSKAAVTPTTPPTVPMAVNAPVPRIEQPLRLVDFTSDPSSLSPASGLASRLGHVKDFIQGTPDDGRPATEETDVWYARTAAAIQFVFVCHDRHVGLIRTHLSRRENILKDDNVSVLLDPLQDKRRGILFSVNPAGVQADALWTENTTSPDYSYDQVWDSSAQITPSGWVAIISIPFRSLRFRSQGQDWGVVFMRSNPRNSETDYWPRIAANISGVLTQEGALRGIDAASKSHNRQLNPYGLAQNVHTLNQLDATHPFFSSRSLEGTVGGEAKAVLKDVFVIDGTINPDFSQVESDQPQFTVNQRYPVYFPELRPFFLENANYFSTPINLLYTRNIVHPEFGARATGKLGHTNLGLLTIDDRSPGEAYGDTDPLHGKHALFAVGRVSQDLGRGSSVGVIYTDEEFADSWNRIGGLDFVARFNDHWTAVGQSVESSTEGLASSTAPASYDAGPASQLEAIRVGRSFNFDSTYQDFSTNFQSQVGFIQTTDVRSNSTNASYQWFPSKGPLQNYGIAANNKIAFDHQGNRVYHYTNVAPYINLARTTTVKPVFGQNSDTLLPKEYPLLTNSRNLTENYGGIILISAPLPQLNVNIVYTHGGNPNYNPAVNASPSLLHEDYLQALLTIQPLRSLTIDNTYLLDRDRPAAGGMLAFENQTLRTKINYQFTRALSARVITEYDSLLVNPAETSLVRTKQIGTQALLTWLPHPGTAVYLGYNNDLQNLDRRLCVRGAEGTCDPDAPALPRSKGYLNDGRQIFLKVSYLLRF